jgi:branched-chain amino acid transport system permease protein
MALWVEQLLNAFGLIGPILLIAVSLSIALASVDVMNAAVGAIFVMSAIVAIRASALAGPVGFVLGAVATSIVLCLAIEVLVLRYQRRRAHDLQLASFAATLGIALVLTALGAWLTQAETLTLMPDFWRIDKIVEIAGVHVRLLAIGVFLAALILTLVWALILRVTAAGKLFRAIADDRSLAQSVGVRVDRVAIQSWIACGVMIGVSTVLILSQTRAIVASTSGNDYLLLPFAAVVAGGLRSLRGTVIAAFLFGVGQVAIGSLTATRPGYRDAIIFLVLLVILMVRPGGLVGGDRTGARDY